MKQSHRGVSTEDAVDQNLKVSRRDGLDAVLEREFFPRLVIDWENRGRLGSAAVLSRLISLRKREGRKQRSCDEDEVFGGGGHSVGVHKHQA